MMRSRIRSKSQRVWQSPGLVRPLSSRIATGHAAQLQHPSGTQQEGDHASEQRRQQKVESKWNRPLDAEKTRARGRQVLKNED
jgi:hypothetical protein